MTLPVLRDQWIHKLSLRVRKNKLLHEKLNTELQWFYFVFSSVTTVNEYSLVSDTPELISILPGIHKEGVEPLRLIGLSS